jgi:BirA family biotin operon repressor/biotin-[acetyl-CoA-carboxylase] ligase
MILIDSGYKGKFLTYLDLNILQTCSSTNDIAIKNAKKGMPEGTSYLSYLQTKGRGRNHNQWVSMKGNLFLSTIFRPTICKLKWHQLSLIIGLSILETLIKLGVDKNIIELKWPNDVLVQKSKISGILLESFDDFIVAGIGLNIVKKPKNEIKWNTTKLYDHTDFVFSLKYIANAVLKIIFKNYHIWENKGFKFFRNKINSYIYNINNKIVFKLNSQSVDISGFFLGVGDNGSLKIKVGNENLEYYSIESFFFPDDELL